MTIPRPSGGVPNDFATDADRQTEPDAGDRATGITDGERIPARVMNWLWGKPIAWVRWLGSIIDSAEEHTYQTPKNRIIYISLADFRTPYSASPHDVRLIFDTGDWLVKAKSDAALHYIPLQSYLRSGQVVKSVSITVEAGAARATVGDRIKLSFRKKAHNFLFPGSETVGPDVEIGFARDSGAAGRQAIGIGPITEEILRADHEYGLLITFGADAGTHEDWLSAVVITIDDPGPRNG